MIRLAIVVEGATELEFVRSLLAPHLLDRGVAATARLLGSHGGNVSVDRLAREMVRYTRPFERVTSLVDLYGFRGRDGASADELEGRVTARSPGCFGAAATPSTSSPISSSTNSRPCCSRTWRRSRACLLRGDRGFCS